MNIAMTIAMNIAAGRQVAARSLTGPVFSLQHWFWRLHTTVNRVYMRAL
jgi:hypothetical protein